MKLSKTKIILFALNIIGIMVISYGLLKWPSPKPCDLRLSQGKCVQLETAKTVEERAKGLGGRDNLSSDRGMLFVFDRPQLACFWMKDTHFSLDIIWLNESKQIIKLKQKVASETYPETYCSSQTKYVIELAAGSAEQNQLKVGQNLAF